MRKEIFGILIFFSVILTLVSLLSYSPADPSINNTGSGSIYNIFGLLGAHIAGLLIGLFGLGAFWVPILLLLFSIQFLTQQPKKNVLLTCVGGGFLIVSTGALFSISSSDYTIFGNTFSAGGLLGIPFKALLVRYADPAGAVCILLVIWVIGLILATRFSLFRFLFNFWRLLRVVYERFNTAFIKLRERKAKTRKRTQIKREHEKAVKRKIEIKKPEAAPAKPPPPPKQEVFGFMKNGGSFEMPSLRYLKDPEIIATPSDKENLVMQSRLLEKKLDDFGVKGKVMAVSPGPVITTFEYEPAPGVKINRVVNLTDDLALALRASSIRIVAPIPGKAAIGIEIPNPAREIVRFKEVVSSSEFEKSKSKIPICLGKDIVGNPVVTELDKMPHLLIAGATGTGKSVALNAMICSFLYKSSPDAVKLIMVDPKRIELSSYDGIPHLITPVVTDVKKATNALFWAVREMENRYELLSEKKARHIDQYNQKIERETKRGAGSELQKLPLIVIIIDELADLMMVASRDVEVALTRLAQMARAAGIHLILATQRPSVDVLTGIIKANFPTRLTFQVSSKTDSRTIIDTNGAENLLGAGDMLFMPPGTAKLQRVHGAYISESELAAITEHLRAQVKPEYDGSVTEAPAISAPDPEESVDEKYDDAVALITQTRQASISMIQRHLRIGYNRAARIIEMMEREGIVGPADGAKPREVLVRNYDEIP